MNALLPALRFEDLERITGRPRNSPGWGRLVAIRTKGITTSEGDVAFVEAGKTRVAAESIYAREYPELFRPADRRDNATANIHRRNLQLEIRRLESELQSAPSSETYGLAVPAPPKTWELAASKRPRRKMARAAARFRDSLTVEELAVAAQRERRPVAHIAAPQTPHRALCGAPMRGIPAPRGVAHCSRCADLWGPGAGEAS